MNPVFKFPKVQTQIYILLALMFAGMMLLAYRAETSDKAIKAAAYEMCKAREAQAMEVNSTRANIGQLIVAMVPDASPESRQAMLDGMSHTQTVKIREDCSQWTQ